jgi:hypothetical protein
MAGIVTATQYGCGQDAFGFGHAAHPARAFSLGGNQGCVGRGNELAC